MREAEVGSSCGRARWGAARWSREQVGSKCVCVWEQVWELCEEQVWGAGVGEQVWGRCGSRWEQVLTSKERRRINQQDMVYMPTWRAAVLFG